MLHRKFEVIPLKIRFFRNVPNAMYRIEYYNTFLFIILFQHNSDCQPMTLMLFSSLTCSMLCGKLAVGHD